MTKQNKMTKATMNDPEFLRGEIARLEDDNKRLDAARDQAFLVADREARDKQTAEMSAKQLAAQRSALITSLMRERSEVVARLYLVDGRLRALGVNASNAPEDMTRLVETAL